VALGTGPGPVPLAPSDGGGVGKTESVPRRTAIGGGRSPAPGVGLSAVGTWSAVSSFLRQHIGFPPFPPDHLGNSLVHLAGLVAA